ncbi:hypothetical protein H5410_010103 [Solanum commersonii]|uniref:ENTH domain-containing protein n=1 Tax=Solanum commersonii TaxID=4109 RepID=A0A9J6AJS4_SOLCO|nr:hypothetical protein H5410_010103 [Solanum commersonii]
MDSPLLHEFKRQASFFVKEKIKTARLVLTDVTHTQLLAEEATTGDLIAPNMQTMRLTNIALSKFDTRNWRSSYKALLLLEYLLTHGPESIAEEFQSDEDVIRQMESFQYVDEKGLVFILSSLCFPFNWRSSVRNMSERVIKLLEDKSFLKKERGRARKVTVGIKGFGSFCKRPVSSEESMKEAFSESLNIESVIDDTIGDAMEWNQHPFYDNHSRASLLSISGLSGKAISLSLEKKKEV